MKNLLDKITKLIDLKSIVTLTLTTAFVFLSVTKVIDTSDFMMIFAMVITFYFAKKEI